jgi:transcriptional regulator with XRE-family HTH domain
MDPKQIGRQIADSRRALRLTQEELARRAGVTRQTVSNIETARNPEAGLTTLLRLLHALDLDLAVTPAGRRDLPTREEILAHQDRVLRS